MWPLIFCQHTIHQVIWPSPGALVLSTIFGQIRTPKSDINRLFGSSLNFTQRYYKQWPPQAQDFAIRFKFARASLGAAYSRLVQRGEKVGRPSVLLAPSAASLSMRVRHICLLDQHR